MYIPEYYEFCCRVKTVSGNKSLEKIPEILNGLDAKRPMIITDEGVSKAGLVDRVKKAMGSRVKIAAVYDTVPADSEVKVVNEISEIYRDKKCDSIIVIGGGSPIDTAKGVNILVSLDGHNLFDYSGVGKITQKLKPLIVIPTTSGTGSEMTLVAVIADHANHRKLAFTSYFLLPDVAILDPVMTETLPGFLTASTGMDALTHACEAYFCMGKNPMSDTTALAAIKLISDNIAEAVRNPKNKEARMAMANGSALAGIAFSNSMVGLVHNIGHAIGGACGVPHGVCMSILLPYGLEFNLHRTGEITGQLLLPLAGAEVYKNTPAEERPAKAISYIRQMNQELHELTDGGHARFLKEVKDRDGNQMIREDDFAEIIQKAMDDPAQFYNPEDLDYDEYHMVLECAYEGKPTDRDRIKRGKI